MPPKRMTPAQVAYFEENGFVAGIPIFTPDEAQGLRDGLSRLETLLQPGEGLKVIEKWERYNDWMYRVVTDPRLLDAIEDLLGPDFYVSMSNIVSKGPNSPDYVPWHQDSVDWNYTQYDVIVAWLAFDDSTEMNGYVQGIPGSYKQGLLPHVLEQPPVRDGGKAMLPFEIPSSYFDASTAVPMPLRAGEISIHHCSAVHGSRGNRTDRRRCGLQIAYGANRARPVLTDPPRFPGEQWQKVLESLQFVLPGRGERAEYMKYLEPPTTFGRRPPSEGGYW